MARQSPLVHSTPPILPSIDASPALEGYLRQFALWAKNSMAGKLDTRSASPGILLQANDAPAGTTPAVFALQVKTDGTLVTVPVAIGGGGP